MTVTSVFVARITHNDTIVARTAPTTGGKSPHVVGIRGGWGDRTSRRGENYARGKYQSTVLAVVRREEVWPTLDTEEASFFLILVLGYFRLDYFNMQFNICFR